MNLLVWVIRSTHPMYIKNSEGAPCYIVLAASHNPILIMGMIPMKCTANKEVEKFLRSDWSKKWSSSPINQLVDESHPNPDGLKFIRNSGWWLSGCSQTVERLFKVISGQSTNPKEAPGCLFSRVRFKTTSRRIWLKILDCFVMDQNLTGFGMIGKRNVLRCSKIPECTHGG